jgi:hypothetical protein
VRINEAVARAVSARDKPAIFTFLRDAFAQAGRVPRSLVVLAPEVPAASTESSA